MSKMNSFMVGVVFSVSAVVAGTAVVSSTESCTPSEIAAVAGPLIPVVDNMVCTDLGQDPNETSLEKFLCSIVGDPPSDGGVPSVLYKTIKVPKTAASSFARLYVKVDGG